MKIHQRKIPIPQLKTDGSDASEEYNARMFNWVKRTAIPTLDEYVLHPFEETLKDSAFKEAQKEERNSEGTYFQKRHTKKWDLAGVTFQVASYRHSSISHETIYGRMQTFLQDCVSDNLDTVHREFVRKTKRGPHVSASYVLDAYVLWREANTQYKNKQDIQIFQQGTEKTYSAVQTPLELMVSLDTNKCRKISEANAETYLRAKALDKKLNGFLSSFTERIRERHDVPVRKGEYEVDYGFSDASAVRYLFFPKDTSVSYGKILDALVKPVEGENIVASTGDLVLLRDLGFKDAYSIGGKGKLSVSTERLPFHLGICTLDRAEKGKIEYTIYDNEHKGVYVRARDILERVADLRRKYDTDATQMKVDFFPAAPVGF